MVDFAARGRCVAIGSLSVEIMAWKRTLIRGLVDQNLSER
jgi:hypothetical protein